MTTIAYRSGVMASDSIAVEGVLKTSCEKLHRVRNCIVGLAGDFYAGHLFLEWFEENEVGENRPSVTEAGDISALILFPDGKLYTCDSNYVFVEEKQEFYAVGTGAPFALSGMRLGLSAEEAVKHAIEFDINSGGDVQKMRIT